MTGEEMCEEDRLEEAPLYTQRLALPLPLPLPRQTLNREDAQLLTMLMKMKLFFTILHEEQWTPWSSHKSSSHSAPRTKGIIVQRPTHMNTDCTCWQRKISTRLSEPLFGWQGSSRSSRAKHVVAWTVATGHDYTMDTAKSRVTSTVDQFCIVREAKTVTMSHTSWHRSLHNGSKLVLATLCTKCTWWY